MSRLSATTLFGSISMVVAAAALGCGAKSKLRPPQEVRPAAITNLRAMSAVNGVELVWSRPQNYTGGARIKTLASFLIFRAEDDSDYIELVRLAYTDAQKLRQSRKTVYIDADTRIGSSYRYKIISITSDGYTSAESNEATITQTRLRPKPEPDSFVLSPGAPTNLPSPTP